MKILNYIKITLRTLFLHRGFSLLTLLGLSLGISMSVLVLGYVYYQVSFDKHYERSEDVYRVVSEGRIGTDSVRAALTPMILASRLEKYPEVEAVTRVADAGEKSVQSEFAKSFEPNILYADSAFFSVFSRPFLLGAGDGCLADSGCVVISRSASVRLFGNRNPVGEIIRLNNKEDFEVRAVFQDVPGNSHFKYDFVLPFALVQKRLRNSYGKDYHEVSRSWFALTCYTYFRATPEIAPGQLLEKLNKEAGQEMDMETRSITDIGAQTELEYNFQNLEHIYLFSDYDFELGVSANPLYVFIFLVIAFFILLVTAFNFMNLTTARVHERSEEAGVRQLFGANRRNLVIRFLTESVLFSFVALFLGLVLVELLLPVFSNMFHLEVFDLGYHDYLIFSVILLGTLFVGLFSGSYPAFIFSGVKPVHLFCENYKFSSNLGQWLRGVLVFVQVFVAVLVSTAAIGMMRQIDYVTNVDFGYNSADLLIVERAHYLENSTDSIVERISNIEGVECASKLFSSPGDPVSLSSFSLSEQRQDGFLLSVYKIDTCFFNTLQAELISGRYPFVNTVKDTNGVLLNEQAVRLIGADRVEGEILYSLTTRSGKTSKLKIAGVVNDIQIGSLKQPLRPTVYVPVKEDEVCDNILVRISPNTKTVITNQIREIWDSAGTGAPFTAITMDEKMRSYYYEDFRYSSLATAFSVLVSIIALLGMTGMVSFLLASRQRELMLQKIAGCPDFLNIIRAFKVYFLFVLAGALLALPVALHMLEVWAASFIIQYQIDYLCFVIPLIVVFAFSAGIAWFTGKRFLSSLSLHQF